tara:strand:+ start:674 stop:799 length:126 start_codon:yes stop_codon:yes gene_type:complete
MSCQKNFVQYVTGNFSGGKSGKKTGKELSIVQKNALLQNYF